MMLLSLLLVAGVLVAAAPYNVTLNSTSPLIAYSPSRTGPSDTTWNVSYTGSSWSSYARQTIGQGSPFTYTTASGAGANVSWQGTGIYFFGETVDGGSLSWTIDGQAAVMQQAQGVLGYKTGITKGWHEVGMRLSGGGGGVSITGVVVTYDLGPTNARFSNSTSSETVWGVNNINFAFDTSQGQWEAATLTGGGGGSMQRTYNHIDTHTPGSRLTMQPPNNSSMIMLYGLTNFDHGLYSVNLTAIEDNGIARTASAVPTNQSFYGYSPWIGIDEVLYVGEMDPSMVYRVTVEFQGQNTSEYWDLARADFLTVNGADSGTGGTGGGSGGSGGTGGTGGTGNDSGIGSESGSSLDIGAIVGGVVGGIVAIALIAMLLAYFVFGRCRKRQKPSAIGKLEGGSPCVIDSPYAETTEGSPFFDNPQMAYARAASGSHPTLPSLSHHPSNAHVTPLLLATPEQRDSADFRDPFRTPPIPVADGSRSSFDSKSPIVFPSSSYTPQSPQRQTVMTVINTSPEDRSASAASTDEGQRSPPAPKPRRSTPQLRRNARGPDGRRRRSEGFTQEQDAGSLPFVPPTEEGGTVPPSYDPAWREGRTDIFAAEDEEDSATSLDGRDLVQHGERRPSDNDTSGQ